jgi:hypothetical protein
VRQFHEHPAVVAWWTACVTPALVHLGPARRRALLALAAAVVGVRRLSGPLGGAAWPAWLAVPLVFGFVYCCYRAAVRFRDLPAAVRRRPQLALHAVLWVVLVAAWNAPPGWPRRGLAAVAVAMPFLVWRLGYLLMAGQRGKAAGTRFADHLFYVWPLWRGTNTPYGKGFDYLTRVEATTPEAFARSQLAGVRLIALGLLWRLVIEVMGAVVYGNPDGVLTPLLGGYHLGIPQLPALLRRPREIGLPVAWLSLYLELVWAVLRLAAKGHVIVGVLRLFGFYAFRNTYKPLLAESVVEFWNRYYYYFKELLVDFFFYPTFVRRFRHAPRLRIVAATFAAAAVGNMYYHLIEQPAFLAGHPIATWNVLHSRLFYCVALAAGISVSMLRERRRRGAVTRGPGGLRRVLRIAGVWTFFAFIHVWAVPGPTPGFAARTRFVLSLFGL